MDTPLAAGGVPGYLLLLLLGWPIRLPGVKLPRVRLLRAWLLRVWLLVGMVAAGTPAAGNTPEVAPGQYTAAAAG